MRSRSLALACILSSCVLGGAAGGLRPLTVFKGTFDLSALAPKAELGSFQFKPSAGLSVIPAALGGYAALIGGLGQEVFLKGLFADGKSILTGELDFTFSVNPNVPGAFDAGVVMDEPTSAFYPTSGSGEEGTLTVGGVPTGASLPIDTEIDFALHYERDLPSANWSYTVVASWAEPHAQGGATTTITLAGTLANSKQRKIAGVGFFKPAQSPALFQLDDVLAIYTPK